MYIYICLHIIYSNYGITTDPETEFNLVMGGGEGLERKIVTMHDGTQVVISLCAYACSCPTVRLRARARV